MTTTTDTDSSLSTFFLALLFVGFLCLVGGLITGNIAGTTTKDTGPCFMEEPDCGETSWAVLLYKPGPILVDGIWSCDLHKDDARVSIDVISLALVQEGLGYHYAETVHVSDL